MSLSHGTSHSGCYLLAKCFLDSSFGLFCLRQCFLRALQKNPKRIMSMTNLCNSGNSVVRQLGYLDKPTMFHFEGVWLSWSNRNLRASDESSYDKHAYQYYHHTRNENFISVYSVAYKPLQLVRPSPDQNVSDSIKMTSSLVLKTIEAIVWAQWPDQWSAASYASVSRWIWGLRFKEKTLSLLPVLDVYFPDVFGRLILFTFEAKLGTKC